MMPLRAFVALLMTLAVAITYTPTPAFSQVPGAGENGQSPGRSETQAPAEPGYLGAQLQELDARAVKTLGLAQDHAILILYPAAGGPAEKTGLMPGDVIVTLNGMPVPALAEFIRNIKKSGRGTEVTLAVWRRGQTMTLSVPLAAVPQTQPDANETLERQIAAYNTITTIFTRDAFPIVWADAQNNLGLAYFDRIQGSRAENLEAAIKAYEAALTVYTREALPRNHLETSRWLGGLLMARNDWRRANADFASAIEAFRILFGEGVDEEEARDVISKAGSLFTDAAFVEAQLGDAKGALQTLSEGRAHMLAAALRQKALALSPAQLIRYGTLQAEIREWAKLADAKGVEGAEALCQLSEARAKLAALIGAARSKSEQENGIDVIAREGHLRRAALVAPIVTNLGSKFLIVTAEDGKPLVRVAEYPELTAEALQAVLRSTGPAGESTGWLVDYAKQGRDTKAWWAAISGIGPKLWTLFAGRLDAELKKAGVADGARLIVLPEGALGLLPLDLARDPASGRSFADAYEIASVPSLEAYLAAARTAGKGLAPSLSETVNTAGDLPFTEIEGALVASHFAGKPSIRLDKANATPDVVLAGLKGKSYWHFATHGVFDWSDARQTGLVMKDRTLLTVGALLDARAGLGTPRLVVLSACETGLYEADRNPGEFTGLPAALLQLGAGGVIASLWQVDDLATALLMAKVYELHFDKGLRPSAALKQAKAWLRGATRQELIAYAKAAEKRARAQQTQLPDLVEALRTGRRAAGSRFKGVWDVLQQAGAKLGVGGGHKSANAKPFAHPYFWSGFVYTGG